MTPAPTAVGLMLCDYVLLEEGTRKPSPIGVFSRLALDRVPCIAPPFSAFAMLTDGSGRGTIQLTVRRLDNDQEIYARQGAIHFPDRLTVINYRFRIRHCSFPVVGWYLFTLFVDGEWVAQRRLEVVEGELP